jgi:hypothetical protein
MREKKIYFLYIFTLSSTHLRLHYSNFFNPQKKNYFGCTANNQSATNVACSMFENFFEVFLDVRRELVVQRG